jgi:hypothetical protein
MAPADLGSTGGTAATVAMFQGYNRVLARPLSTAVRGETVSSGGRSESRCFVSLTSEELSEALHLDTTLSAGLGPLSLFRGKSGLHESLHSTTYSVSVTVFARHISQVTSMTGARLSEGMVPPTTETELDDFVEFYGDSFVSTLVEGGEYHGVYTFYSQTRQEQKDLVKGLAAAGILNGISIGLDLQKSISHFLSTAQVNSSFRQLMSGHLNPSYPDPENLIAFAADFGSLPLSDPTVIDMATTGYESVPGIGRAFQAVAANRDHFTGTAFESGLMNRLARISELRNQMKWVEATYETYGGHDDERLIDGLTLTRNDSETIRSQVNAYDRKATTPLAMPPLPSLDRGTPHLRVSAEQAGPFGGTGGDPFSFMDLDTCLRSRTRISALKLRAGSRVDQLEVTYAGETGEKVEHHGGMGGSEGATTRLREGEVITEVSGRFGSRIDQLTITTSRGQKVSGGGMGGTHVFRFTPPPGSFIVGFSGRSGSGLDSLVIHTAAFQPAEWEPLEE